MSVINNLVKKAKNTVSSFLNSTDTSKTEKPATQTNLTTSASGSEYFEPSVPATYSTPQPSSSTPAAPSSSTGEMCVDTNIEQQPYFEPSQQSSASSTPPSPSTSGGGTSGGRTGGGGGGGTSRGGGRRRTPPPLGTVDVIQIKENGKVMGWEDTSRKMSVFAPGGKPSQFFNEPEHRIIAEITTTRKFAGTKDVINPELARKKRELLQSYQKTMSNVEQTIRKLESGEWRGIRVTPELAETLGLGKSTSAIYGKSAAHLLRQYLEKLRQEQQRVAKTPDYAPVRKYAIEKRIKFRTSDEEKIRQIAALHPEFNIRTERVFFPVQPFTPASLRGHRRPGIVSNVEERILSAAERIRRSRAGQFAIKHGERAYGELKQGMNIADRFLRPRFEPAGRVGEKLSRFGEYLAERSWREQQKGLQLARSLKERGVPVLPAYLKYRSHWHGLKGHMAGSIVGTAGEALRYSARHPAEMYALTAAGAGLGALGGVAAGATGAGALATKGALATAGLFGAAGTAGMGYETYRAMREAGRQGRLAPFTRTWGKFSAQTAALSLGALGGERLGRGFVERTYAPPEERYSTEAYLLRERTQRIPIQQRSIYERELAPGVASKSETRFGGKTWEIVRREPEIYGLVGRETGAGYERYYFAPEKQFGRTIEQTITKGNRVTRVAIDRFTGKFQAMQYDLRTGKLLRRWSGKMELPEYESTLRFRPRISHEVIEPSMYAEMRRGFVTRGRPQRALFPETVRRYAPRIEFGEEFRPPTSRIIETNRRVIMDLFGSGRTDISYMPENAVRIYGRGRAVPRGVRTSRILQELYGEKLVPQERPSLLGRASQTLMRQLERARAKLTLPREMAATIERRASFPVMRGAVPPAPTMRFFFAPPGAASTGFRQASRAVQNLFMGSNRKQSVWQEQRVSRMQVQAEKLRYTTSTTPRFGQFTAQAISYEPQTVSGATTTGSTSASPSETAPVRSFPSIPGIQLPFAPRTPASSGGVGRRPKHQLLWRRGYVREIDRARMLIRRMLGA